MIIGLHISIALNLLALFLFFWLKKQQQIDNGLHSAELEHTHQGMNALMNDFNNYQVETDRKIIELEKKLKIKSNSTSKNIKQIYKDLPNKIRSIIGHIEFSQNNLR